MLEKEETKLEIYGFGDDDDDNDDTFYCLVDLTKSPEGIDLEKLSMVDPRNFDDKLDEMGCIVLIGSEEMDELINRGHIDDTDLHQGLYDLAVQEGIID